MKNTKQQLIIDQVDRKLSIFSPLKTVSVPGKGWIHTVRTALNMSLRQLGERLGITPSSVQDIEKREKEGAITIKALREAAAALDMQLVYGLIPKDGSLETMIEKRVEELATQIVERTSQTMALEDQEVSKERIRKAIKQQADELKYELPRTLWD
ncbi:MAG: mobile mystery protein A [Opitutaceae bacterium]|nr:mobile mystery protein A [Opitutaceae bacterium]